MTEQRQMAVREFHAERKRLFEAIREFEETWGVAVNYGTTDGVAVYYPTPHAVGFVATEE